MKKITTFLLVFMASFSLNAQDFYDLNTIQTIKITFAESNWDALLDAQKAGAEDYTLAQSVEINGTIFDSVGVKYKGNSTYSANQVKNPFHIELDTYKDHEYDGYTDIKLSNVAKDPSFLREVLSYQILGQYMHTPKSNYANVYVNGNLIGLYSNSEAITKKFVKSRFYSKKNTFVKCNPIAGAGPQSTELPDLVYLGQDSVEYYPAYEIKSDYGWQELINLMDTLENNTADIEKILNVDRALWMHAFNNVFVNLDSYLGSFTQNYYLYRDDNQQFNSIVWDLNECFGVFSRAHTGNLNGNTAKQRMSHLQGATDTGLPLVNKLLEVPMYKRMYLAHIKTMVKENFENGSYLTTGASLQTLIDAAVQADNNKFFTYANFQTNLTNDITGGGGGPGGGGGAIGIGNLMDARTTYLLGLSDFTAAEPVISDIALSNTSPIVGQNVELTAAITDATTAYLGYRSDVEKPFVRIQLFDDGAHNDGAANDGTFGIEMPIEGALVQYYIYAENSTIGKFSPQRAEHEYHAVTATVSNPSVGDIVINEFMASNEAAIADQDGEYDDWIELFNNTGNAIDLAGYYLSDDATDLQQWAFPVGTSLPPNGYLTVWADNDDTQAGLHANFKLSAAAESIFLTNAAGDIEDEVSYVNQTTDVSYGRFPNGTGPFQTMVATFGSENSNTSSSQHIDNQSFDIKIQPNPVVDLLQINIENDTQKHTLSIFSATGTLMHQGIINGSAAIQTAKWAPGVYVVRVDGAYRLVVKS